MSLVMEHLLEKVYEPNEVPYFADGQVPIAVVRRLIEQAEQATEQRITKLLDGLMDFETNTKARLEHKLALQVLKDALIKGENK